MNLGDFSFINTLCNTLINTLYNSAMSIPDRIITEAELRRNTGERGTRKFIAYGGIIYDVTDCPKWRLDLHENLHFPGQDLTKIGRASCRERVEIAGVRPSCHRV